MKNKIKFLSALSLVSILASCGGVTSSSESMPSSVIGGNPSSATSSGSTTSVITGKTNKDFKKAQNTYVDEEGKTQHLNYQTIFTNDGNPHLDPLNEQHVLVVPFGFADPNLQSVQTDANIDRINTTFFGTQDEVDAVGGWTSVANYYNTSSYGKASFKGQVLPTWCTYDGTSEQFKKDSGGQLGVYAAEYARTFYLEEYAKENHGSLGADAKPFSYFDNDGDGFLDLVWVVYSHPIGSTDDWWAYVTYTPNTENKRVPEVKTLAFASIDFMKEGFNGYDPHTFIHETGHTFGLDDYYDYNNTWKPMASIDMMDSNVGDHNAFSKFAYGWVSPWVVDDTSTIVLRPTTTTGDCFIIPSQGYNNTAFDEYLMVEFMAPVGLSERDYKNGYKSTTGFTEPGIRITHVDARVSADDHDDYLKTANDVGRLGRDVRVCNTFGGRYPDHRDTDWWVDDQGKTHYYTLLSTIESTINDKNWTNSPNYNATNSALFKAGHRFSLDNEPGQWGDVYMPSKSNLWNKAKTITGWNKKVQEFTVDDSIACNYRIKVNSIRPDAESGYVATISVTNLNK